MKICPKCRNDEHIKKISAIYKEGTTEGGPQTLLARMMTPPQRPAEPNTSCFWYVAPFVFWPISVLVSPIGEIKIAIVILFVLGGLIAFAGKTDDAIKLIGLALLIPTFPMYYVGFSREAKKRKAIYNIKFEQYEKKIKIWDQIYYCSKHDYVINPTTGKYLESGRLNELLEME